MLFSIYKTALQFLHMLLQQLDRTLCIGTAVNLIYLMLVFSTYRYILSLCDDHEDRCRTC
jgi:hypothetical protein